jgi:hypothetical protein
MSDQSNLTLSHAISRGCILPDQLVIIKQYLDIIVALVTIIGLPIGIYGLILNSKHTQNSLDVQIAISLAIKFDEKWDNSWEKVISKGVKFYALSDLDKKVIIDVLNWIDWLGVFINRGALVKSTLILDSIGANIVDTIVIAKEKLNEDGKMEWKGVFGIAKRLNLLGPTGEIAPSIQLQSFVRCR